MKQHCWFLVFILFFVFCLYSPRAESAEETTKELEVVKMLQGGHKVFLCFYEPTDPNLNIVKENLEAVGNNFKGAVNVVYVSSADVNENKFTEQFIAQSGYISVFVLVPPRNIVAELRGNDITKENLMKVLFPSRKPGGGCGCSGGSKPSGCSGGGSACGGSNCGG